MPLPTAGGVRTTLLGYTHFSVLMRPDRRQAAATAVVIDDTSLVELDRKGLQCRLDQLSAEEQAGAELYRDNDLDRGHLVH